MRAFSAEVTLTQNYVITNGDNRRNLHIDHSQNRHWLISGKHSTTQKRKNWNPTKPIKSGEWSGCKTIRIRYSAHDTCVLFELKSERPFVGLICRRAPQNNAILTVPIFWQRGCQRNCKSAPVIGITNLVQFLVSVPAIPSAACLRPCMRVCHLYYVGVLAVSRKSKPKLPLSMDRHSTQEWQPTNDNTKPARHNGSKYRWMRY